MDPGQSTTADPPLTGEAVELVVEARGLSRSFDGRTAVEGVDLELDRGSFLAVLGPSGSGKTTLLRMIAGFERPEAGSVRIAGRIVADAQNWVEPEARRVGMVFQQGALFPHLTVAGNVGFGATRTERVREYLELVGLERRADGYPHELSGGERQRVALARALAAEPEVVLLDEPFSALDAGLRERLREEVTAILRAAGTSTLLVTHDQAEALSLAERVAVLRDGRLEQVGTPEEVYERPCSQWVATFLGEADILPGTARDGIAECELGRFPVAAEMSGTVELVIRPESIAIGHRPGSPADPATVVGRSFYGHDQLVELEMPSGLRLRSRRLGFPAWHPGDRVHVWVDGPVTAITPGQEPGSEGETAR
jgi:iron(III) transport system ATP-binding protein